MVTHRLNWTRFRLDGDYRWTANGQTQDSGAGRGSVFYETHRQGCWYASVRYEADDAPVGRCWRWTCGHGRWTTATVPYFQGWKRSRREAERAVKRAIDRWIRGNRVRAQIQRTLGREWAVLP